MIASRRIRRPAPTSFCRGESLFKGELLSIRQNNAAPTQSDPAPFKACPHLVGERLHLKDALVADGEVPGETLPLPSSDTSSRITKASVRVLLQFLLLSRLGKKG